MDINTVLGDLGKRLNVSDISLNDNGICRLIFDERMTVDIESDDVNDLARLYSVVAPMAEEPGTDVYETLLGANLVGLDGGDNYFGIDFNTRELVLFSNLDMNETDQQSFYSRLEGFVNDLEYWLDKYEKGEIGTPVELDQLSESGHEISDETHAAGLRL